MLLLCHLIVAGQAQTAPEIVAPKSSKLPEIISICAASAVAQDCDKRFRELDRMIIILVEGFELRDGSGRYEGIRVDSFQVERKKHPWLALKRIATRSFATDLDLSKFVFLFIPLSRSLPL